MNNIYDDESNDNNYIYSRNDGSRKTTSEITHQLFQQYIENDDTISEQNGDLTVDNLINQHRISTLMRIRELKRQLDTCLQSLAQLRQANNQLQQQNEVRLQQLGSNRSKISCRG